MNDVEVIYTMWSNLKKTPAMEVGQVGFHKEKEVRKIKIARRSNEIVNRLEKTKKTENPGKNYCKLIRYKSIPILQILEQKEKRETD